MAAEQKQAEAATTTTEFDGAEWLKKATESLGKDPDAAAKSRNEATLDSFIKAALQPGHTVSKNVVTSIKSWVALLDKKLTDQVNEIMHHPDFQKLESTWRGLHYLCDKTETGPLMKIKVLNVTKSELQADFDDAGDAFNESETYKKIHDEGYGILGGEPYGMLVGDYAFDCKNTMDVAFVRSMARIAASSHCPFVAAVSAQAFGMERYTDLVNRKSLGKAMNDADNVEYAEWRAFRESADSRYVALTCPRVLARQVYGQKFRPVSSFQFEENVDGTNHDKYLWMSAAWAYAARVTDAYSRYGWMAATRGVEGGGKVEGLPVHTFPTEDGDVAMKCPSEVAITDAREKEFDSLGFISLVHYKNTGAAAFLSGASCQKPLKYSGPHANANSILSAKFNLMLCVSRFSHMLKVIVRNRVGSFMEREDLEKKLNRWILDYTLGNPETASMEDKAKRPLRWAEIKVESVPGQPGVFNAVAHLCPHTQLEGLDLSMRLVAQPRTK
jgi:type VI secretion system protein ImpC